MRVKKYAGADRGPIPLSFRLKAALRTGNPDTKWQNSHRRTRDDRVPRWGCRPDKIDPEQAWEAEPPDPNVRVKPDLRPELDL